MAMPGRKFTLGASSYRYSINGQEKEAELNENITAALYWEYDSRIGRRWNVDPKPNISISTYCTFGNNPVFSTDISGDTTIIFNKKGKYLKTIYDKLANQVVFVSGRVPMNPNFRKSDSEEDQAKFVREKSIAFIGENTIAEAKKLEEKANKENHEIFFLGKITASKELTLTELFLPAEAYKGNNEINIGEYIDKVSSNKEQLSSFLIGHTHQLNLELNNLIQAKLPTLPGKAFYFTKDNGSGDYGPLLNREFTKYGYIPGTYDQGYYTTVEKGQTAALIITHTGITVYGTGTHVNVPRYQGEYTSVDDIIPPVNNSFVNYKTFKK